jgi:hypothetical protein
VAGALFRETRLRCDVPCLALGGSKGGIDQRDHASVLGLIFQFRQVLAYRSKSSTQPFDFVGRVKIQRVKKPNRRACRVRDIKGTMSA